MWYKLYQKVEEERLRGKVGKAGKGELGSMEDRKGKPGKKVKT